MLSESQLRRNAVFHVLDGVFFFAALAMFSREVYMPAMIRELSDSDLLIGLIPFIYWTGYVVPQTWFARRVEGLPHKKTTVVACCVFQRIGWLLLAALLPALWGGGGFLVAFFCVLGLSSLGSGLIMPVWTDWYAKTVPETAWGRILGARIALFGLLALALGPAGRWIMRNYSSPRRFQILLFCSVGFYALSTLSLLVIREEREDGLPNQRHVRWLPYVRRLASIPVRRPDFALFIVASLFIGVPIMLMATYLTKYGLGFPFVSDEVTGTFTTFLYAFMSVGSLLGGRFSDRAHPLAPFRVLPLAVLAAAACAYGARGPAAVSIAFIFLGLAIGAQITVALPAIWRYAGPHRRPSYSAVYFSAQGLSAALVPAFAGILLERGLLSYPRMFLICGGLASVGWIMFLALRPAEAEWPEATQ